MNNRYYNSSNTFFNSIASLNQSSDFEEKFNNALIETMQEVNSGSGISYYHSGLGPQYQNGFANNEYWDVVGFYNFQMKPGRKPSEAIRAFFSGLTVADCGNVVSFCQLAALLKVL